MSLIWIPPPRNRHERAVGREDQGRVERLGRGLVGAAGPPTSHPAGKILRLQIAWPREGEDLPSLMARDLRHDVRRCTKAIDSDAARFPGHPEGPIADQASAE